MNIFENLKKNIFKTFEKIFWKFWKNIWTKSFLWQSAAPSKYHKSYGKSFKKFNGGGGGGVVACLIIVSLQVLPFEILSWERGEIS